MEYSPDKLPGTADGQNVRKFSPPANITDFSPERQPDFDAIWDRKINDFFDGTIKSVSKGKPADWECPFYNPADTGREETEIPVVVNWIGFPRTLNILYEDNGALTNADTLQPLGGTDAAEKITSPLLDPSGSKIPFQYRLQDEYLEWRVEFDLNQKDVQSNSPKIVSITFTCESPEYWETLASYDFDKLVELYRRYVSPIVQPEDLRFQTNVFDSSQKPLFEAGTYNPLNRWNTTCGIMHLTHPDNLLQAEIQLGADGTVLRKGISTLYLNDPTRLTCCSRFGNPNRSSDPQIGCNVNKLAQLGAHISLQDPVALYIDHWDPNIITFEDGRPVPFECFHVKRGKERDPQNPGRILRLEVKVPADWRSPEGQPCVLGDLFVDGKRIAFGGQIARHIHMQITATYFGVGTIRNALLPCSGLGWVLSNNKNFTKSAGLGTGSPAQGFEPAFEEDFYCNTIDPGDQTNEPARYACSRYRHLEEGAQ